MKTIEGLMAVFFSIALLVCIGMLVYFSANEKIEQTQLCYSQNGKIVKHEYFKSCQENGKVLFILK